MNTQLLFGVVIVPAVVGLVEVAKDIGLPSRFAPAAAVLFGIAAGMAQLYASSYSWIQAVVIGISLGLSAVGLYSGATTVLSALQKPSDPRQNPTVPPSNLGNPS